MNAVDRAPSRLQMIKHLNNIIDDVKRKPYDLLDFFRNQFDRDFLEFNVNIHDLEIQLQVGTPAARVHGSEDASVCARVAEGHSLCSMVVTRKLFVRAWRAISRTCLRAAAAWSPTPTVAW